MCLHKKNIENQGCYCKRTNSHSCTGTLSIWRAQHGLLPTFYGSGHKQWKEDQWVSRQVTVKKSPQPEWSNAVNNAAMSECLQRQPKQGAQIRYELAFVLEGLIAFHAVLIANCVNVQITSLDCIDLDKLFLLIFCCLQESMGVESFKLQHEIFN